MPELLVGPMLRFVGDGCATVWVETDGPCEVAVLDSTSRTFAVGGHHYAIVIVEGLGHRSETPYEVHLDGDRVWPLDDSWPASVIRTRGPRDAIRLAFGSCRVTAPLDDEDSGVDALHALGVRMRGLPRSEWPDELLLVGDQVYADENISPQTTAFIASRRDTSDPDGPGTEVADLEEYAHLYREAWAELPIRWLLSTVPSAMIFDDHDVRDDWNTSGTWRRQMQELPWWQGRIEAGLMSYWLYQHLGNLPPEELRTSELLESLRGEEDGEPVLREYARKADAEADGGGPTRWSYVRDLGGSRLVVLDSRCGRVVGGDRREMLDEPEWAWLEENVAGDVDHLLLATSLPFLLPPGVHHIEAWDEAVTDGAWGGRFKDLGEKIRQGADLEHWAAFGTSFQRMVSLLAEIGSGAKGRAPATITFLSGDVHFAYLAQARFPASANVTSRVFQAVCSPIRNPLPPAVSLGQRAAWSRPVGALLRGLARTAGVASPDIGWGITGGPAFGNEIATLDLDGRSAVVTLERSVEGPELEHSFSRLLS